MNFPKFANSYLKTKKKELEIVIYYGAFLLPILGLGRFLVNEANFCYSSFDDNYGLPLHAYFLF